MRIAIVGSSSGPNSFGIGKNYAGFASFIAELNDTELELTIIPPSPRSYHESLVKEIDLLILPGGADLSPHLYGQIPSWFTGNPDVFKEDFFKTHLSTYINARVPIFGICLGFQMLNVYFGGQLKQNVNNTRVHQNDSRFTEAHKVALISLEKAKGGEYQTMAVNSHHHQAVTPNLLSKDFRPMSVSSENHKDPLLNNLSRGTLIESFKHRTLPIAGVQWHPEEWFDDHSTELIFSILEHKKELV